MATCPAKSPECIGALLCPENRISLSHETPLREILDEKTHYLIKNLFFLCQARAEMEPSAKRTAIPREDPLFMPLLPLFLPFLDEKMSSKKWIRESACGAP
jgi:hypothetical protein